MFSHGEMLIQWPLSLFLLSESTFSLKMCGIKCCRMLFLFSVAITYIAKMQAMATQTQVRVAPHPLNSHICAYIDRSQLPVKCQARLDTSIGIRPNVAKPPEACMLRGPPFCEPSYLPFTLHKPPPLFISKPQFNVNVQWCPLGG